MSVRQPNGEVTRPMGDHPRGLLMYTAGGHMSVQITAGDRPLFGASGRGGSIEEAADALRTYIAYCGTYRVDDAEGAVYHEPECHSCPNGVGVPLQRFTFTGDRLLLSGDRPPRPMPPIIPPWSGSASSRPARAAPWRARRRWTARELMACRVGCRPASVASSPWLAAQPQRRIVPLCWWIGIQVDTYAPQEFAEVLGSRGEDDS